jgi:hypothetical protein
MGWSRWAVPLHFVCPLFRSLLFKKPLQRDLLFQRRQRREWVMILSVPCSGPQLIRVIRAICGLSWRGFYRGLRGFTRMGWSRWAVPLHFVCPLFRSAVDPGNPGNLWLYPGGDFTADYADYADGVEPLGCSAPFLSVPCSSPILSVPCSGSRLIRVIRANCGLSWRDFTADYTDYADGVEPLGCSAPFCLSLVPVQCCL